VSSGGAASMGLDTPYLDKKAKGKRMASHPLVCSSVQ